MSRSLCKCCGQEIPRPPKPEWVTVAFTVTARSAAFDYRYKDDGRMPDIRHVIDAMQFEFRDVASMDIQQIDFDRRPMVERILYPRLTLRAE